MRRIFEGLSILSPLSASLPCMFVNCAFSTLSGILDQTPVSLRHGATLLQHAADLGSLLRLQRDRALRDHLQGGRRSQRLCLPLHRQSGQLQVIHTRKRTGANGKRGLWIEFRGERRNGMMGLCLNIRTRCG